MVRDPEKKRMGEKSGGFYCYKRTIGGPSHVPAEWEYLKEQLSKTFQIWNSDDLSENYPGKISKTFSPSQISKWLKNSEARYFGLGIIANVKILICIS